ncbi:hypothetical protein J4573_48210 [Actinomadura barringtoniae]|uniref:Uncharacterized protein n=1 Tax=Actinomadura barringtoniae TaxID=1427535 RepID=A0A939TA30_9ACTN|nr:hypothetical protein [Actinomadura barringtoniae]MBO2454944.1 hypothetical protein [Actinomadura barringtoniae]
MGQVNWLAFTCGPWAAHYRDTVRAWPPAIALAIVAAESLGEEGLRASELAVLRPAGGTLAVGLVFVLSLLTVRAHPVAARRDPWSALTAAGALGAVHSAVLWAVPALVPLVAARTALYVLAVI